MTVTAPRRQTCTNTGLFPTKFHTFNIKICIWITSNLYFSLPDDSEMYGTCSADDEAENETENVTDIYSTWEQLAKSKPSPAEITSTLQVC